MENGEIEMSSIDYSAYVSPEAVETSPMVANDDVSKSNTLSSVKSCLKKTLSNPKKKSDSEEADIERELKGGADSRDQVTNKSTCSFSNDVKVIECVDEEFPDGVPVEISSEHSMTFQDVCYSVRGLNKCQITVKNILKNVSGVMVPGINAIMGPTGGGKTTLLDILAKRKGTSGCSQQISGTVLLNGEHLPDDFKLKTGYVVQDDILDGALTVRENLHFSAALRLPLSTTRKERTEKVGHIIHQLGLINSADTYIGTDFIRGVSGGERRRTVIGMELITDPVVLFMDEPTTGLDAHTAVSVMQTLQDWCMEGNRLVIMSIHQPRYSIFKLFDTLTLLSLGSIVYQGRANHVVNYFEKLGYGIEDKENPADFLLDILNDSHSAITLHRRTIRQKKPDKKLDLVEMFKNSEESKVVENYLKHVATEPERRPKSCRERITGFCKEIHWLIKSYFWQMFCISVRSLVTSWRNPTTLLFQTAIMIFVALIVGVVYFQTDDRVFDNLANYAADRIGALFVITLVLEFGVLAGFDVFIDQRALFIHENSGGFYHVLPYLVSKIVTDILYLRLTPVLIFGVIVYFMIGFIVEVDKVFIFLFLISLGTVALSSVAFAISAVIKNRSIAVVLFALHNLTSIVFSGVLIDLSLIPSFLIWVQYISIYQYMVQSMAINEISGQFYNDTPTNISGVLVCIDTCVNGTGYLEFNNFRTDSEWIWVSTGALIGIIAFLWILTYLLLRVVKKHK